MTGSQTLPQEIQQDRKGLQSRSQLHLARKIWHVSTGAVGVLSFTFFCDESDQLAWAYAIGVVGILGLVFDLVRLKFQPVNHLALKLGGPFYRKSEASSLSGFPFYALGVSMTLFFFELELAILAIWFLILSDPFSSLIGVLYGKTKILPNKTLEGSSAGFCICYVMTLFYCLWLNPELPSFQLILFSVFAGLIGSASELLSAVKIDDNLTIPIISGLGMSALNHIIPVFSF